MNRTGTRSLRPAATRRQNRRRHLLALTATGAAAALLSPVAPAWGQSVSGPKYPVYQGVKSETWTESVSQSSCDPAIKPGVRKFRDMMLGYYRNGRDGGISRLCAIGGTSEHKEGRAWDWMLNVYDTADRATANKAINWLLAPGVDGKPAVRARRLGLQYMIFNKKIWSAYRASDGWRAYYGPNPHTDHIHFTFSWQGAMGRTSFWDGTVAGMDYGPCVVYSGDPAPLHTAARNSRCPSPKSALYKVTRSRVWLGSSGTDVKRAQTLLKITADGVFGNQTRGAVLSFQKSKNLPQTGAMDATTWGVLDPTSREGYEEPPPPAEEQPLLKQGMSGDAVKTLQTKLGMPIDLRTGYFGAVTKTYVSDFQATVGITVTGTSTEATWDKLTPITTTTLKYGMKSPDVKTLQIRLGLAAKYQTGYFGDITKAALKKFQTKHSLPVTGIAYAPVRAWLRM